MTEPLTPASHSQAPAEPLSDDRAWLIEWQAHGYGPQWWGFNYAPGKHADWCADTNNAIRFSRKEDAECMRLHIIAVEGNTGQHAREQNITCTEHEWFGIEAAVRAQAPSEQALWCSACGEGTVAGLCRSKSSTSSTCTAQAPSAAAGPPPAASTAEADEVTHWRAFARRCERELAALTAKMTAKMTPEQYVEFLGEKIDAGIAQFRSLDISDIDPDRLKHVNTILAARDRRATLASTVAAASPAQGEQS